MNKSRVGDRKFFLITSHTKTLFSLKMDWKSTLSPQAQNGLRDAEVAEVEDLQMFSIDELKANFGFTMADVVKIRRKRPREDPDGDDSDDRPSKNATMAGITPFTTADACLRETMPDRWQTLDLLSLRSAVLAVAGQVTNFHTMQELEFLIAIIPLCDSLDERPKWLIWVRLAQVCLKNLFPSVASEVQSIWAVTAARTSDVTPEGFLRQYQKVKGELEKKAGPYQMRPQRPPFRPKQFGRKPTSTK